MYILIVNEDPLGRALAGELVKHGHEVAYLDEDPEYCSMVATELGCLTIQGETTNLRFLQEAGIDRADVLVVLLDKDIKNIMVGLFGRQFKVPRIYARLRQEHYRAAYELAGIETIFSAFDFLLNQLLVAIEEPDVRHVMALGDGRIEIAGIGVPANSPLISHPLSTLWNDQAYPLGALVLGLLKHKSQDFYLARENQHLQKDDEVFVAASRNEVHSIADIINGRRRRRLLR